MKRNGNRIKVSDRIAAENCTRLNVTERARIGHLLLLDPVELLRL